MKFILLILVCLSTPIFGQVKGSSYHIGEYFLTLSGHSYEELENLIYQNEVLATSCSNKKVKLSFDVLQRTSDLKDCEETSRRVFLKPDNTGFNVSDFFHVGCVGSMKSTGRNLRSSQEETKEYKFESRLEGSRLRFINLDRSQGNEDLPFNNIEENPDDFLVLNKTYTYSPPYGRSKYQYKISESSDKRIEVELLVENKNLGRNRLLINCLSKSLEEMNSIVSLHE